MNKLQLKRNTKQQIKVWIEPCNENQELNYIESFIGTPEQIINYSLGMIEGLQKTLRNGTFTVKLESPNLDYCIYIDRENIYDSNFEIIATIDKAVSMLQ